MFRLPELLGRGVGFGQVFSVVRVSGLVKRSEGLSSGSSGSVSSPCTNVPGPNTVSSLVTSSSSMRCVPVNSEYCSAGTGAVVFSHPSYSHNALFLFSAMGRLWIDPSANDWIRKIFVLRSISQAPRFDMRSVPMSNCSA